MTFFQKKMCNRKLLFLALMCGMFVLNSCSDLKKGLGMEKDVPNKFLIEKRNPLVLPPDYKMLPPDSKTKAEQNKKTVDSLKSVLDKNLRNAESQKLPVDNISTYLEKEILKQIK